MISLPAGHQTQPAKVLIVSGEGMLPLAVARWVSKSNHALSAFVTDDESTLEALLAALPRFLPDHRVLSVPAWDTLPYDRARPSRRVTGTRVASLASLVEAHDQPILVLTTRKRCRNAFHRRSGCGNVRSGWRLATNSIRSGFGRRLWHLDTFSTNG
jgi:transcription-repair coupling factor (superfamily II helicase)